MTEDDIKAIEASLRAARLTEADCGVIHKPRSCSPCEVAVNAPVWLAALCAEVKRLRAALGEFGEHDIRCRIQLYGATPYRKPGAECECGLDAALGDDRGE